MRCATRTFSLALALTLAACGGGGEQPKSAGETAPERYAAPVAVGCVGREGKPAEVQPLNQRYSDEEWAAMPLGAKASAVAAQGGERLNYEDRQRASTAGCW